MFKSKKGGLMKKVLIVLVCGFMMFGVMKANAQMGAYGEYLGSAAAGFGGGVNFGMVKVGAHFSGWGVSVGGGVNVPVAKLMDNKLDLAVDAQFHYSFLGIWSIPAGVTVDYKITDKMSVFGGGGVDISTGAEYWVDYTAHILLQPVYQQSVLEHPISSV